MDTGAEVEDEAGGSVEAGGLLTVEGGAAGAEVEPETGPGVRVDSPNQRRTSVAFSGTVWPTF